MKATVKDYLDSDQAVIILEDKRARDEFLNELNKNNVMTRPVWTMLTKLKMYQDCQSDDLNNAKWLEARVVNIPSSARFK